MLAIVFDFGGVVANFSIGLGEFVAEILQVSPNRVNATLFADGETLIKGKISELDFWKNYALTLERPLPLDWFERMIGFLIHSLSINQKIVEIVQSLQKKKFITPLLSNISPWQANVFKKLGYFDYFDPLILSCENGLMKPDPEIFQLLCEKIKLKPQDCLFIDDEKKNINSAHCIGFRTIYFKSEEDLLLQIAKHI